MSHASHGRAVDHDERRVNGTLDAIQAVMIADLVLAAIRREYPNHVSHLLESDADVRPPRELTPAFFGSFDWHSAVHGHWALARILRCCPSCDACSRIRAALDASFSTGRLNAEHDYLSRPARASFERPYGLAWLLQLCAELREWNDRPATQWLPGLAPLETLAVDRLSAWLARLPWPLRVGTHAQTAFALGLMLDWAALSGATTIEDEIGERARAWFLGDVDAPIDYEPSGHDFLSPVLGEADLMRRVLSAQEFARWLERFLPDLESASARRWLTPVTSPDPSDGQLSHLDGLNLSRAWMLEGVASALPSGDARAAQLSAAAEAHARKSLTAVRGEHYAGAHWLGTFAIYRLTRRGISSAAARS